MERDPILESLGFGEEEIQTLREGWREFKKNHPTVRGDTPLSEEEANALYEEYRRRDAYMYGEDIQPYTYVMTENGLEKKSFWDVLADKPKKEWDEEILKLYKLQRGIAIKRMMDANRERNEE